MTALSLGVLRRLLQAQPVVVIPQARDFEVGASGVGNGRAPVSDPADVSTGASHLRDEVGNTRNR